MKVIISGGGTGGHIFPAIAIANEIKRQRPEAKILFVGAEGKQEMTRVPKAGYEIKGLPIRGFQRKLTLTNLMFPFKLMNSLRIAGRILKEFEPDVVIGVGGYASGPTLEMATRLNIPTLIQEQNSFPGITNRLLAKKVNRICTVYSGMEKWFPIEKTVLTGNPIRSDLGNIGNLKNNAIEHFGFDKSKKTIVVTGGSLGARTLNEMMKNNAEILRENSGTQVLWQAGKLYIEEFSKTETAQLENVKIREFIDRMDFAYAMADLMICRAGAMTISELCLTGKPSILIPSPNVAEDHQTKNAKSLSGKKAAILIKDSEADTAISRAVELIDNQSITKEMSMEVLKLAKPDATQDIVSEIFKLLKG